MSCTTTGLININEEGNPIPCDKLCSYEYKYEPSSITVENMGSYLRLKYNTSPPNKEPVIYNNPQNGEEHLYRVKEIRIYSPSLHLYGKPAEKTDGEIIISHTSLTSKNLLVCIPLTRNNGSSPLASEQLDKILNETEELANSIGEKSFIQNFQLSLNEFIPKKQYYNYQATQPYSPTNEVYYVVFPKSASINLPEVNLTKLREIISVHSEQFCISSAASKTDALYSYSTATPVRLGTSSRQSLTCKSLGSSPDKGEITFGSGPESSEGFTSGNIIAIVLFSLILIVIAVLWLYFYLLQKGLFTGATAQVDASTTN